MSNQLRRVALCALALLAPACSARVGHMAPSTDAGSALDAGPADAGPASDAGRPDAGPTDAGPTDAGEPDAGLSDAGPADAGEPDAGELDAGLVDAGAPDAGVEDAGPSDAGFADAGAEDAGSSDAGPDDAGLADAGEPDAGSDDAGAFDAGAFDAGAFDAGPADAGPEDAGAPDAGPCPIPEVPADALNVQAAPYLAQGDGVTDDTNAIQQAINAAPDGGTVYVPDGTYRIRVTNGSGGTVGLALKSNLTLQLSPGATLAAIPNSATTYAIVRVLNAAHVRVYGGTLLGERGQHTGDGGGEWGMGLDIESSDDVQAVGVTAQECWGDGFYVSNTSTGGSSTNVTLCGCSGLHNRRQGLSVVAADGVTVDSCLFADTQGTPPEAGIDLEPNAGTSVQHVLVRNTQLLRNADGMVFTRGTANSSLEDSVADGNLGFGVDLSGVGNTATGNAVRRSRLSHNGSGGAKLKSAGNTVDACEASDNPGYGIYDESNVDWTVGDVQQNQVTNNQVLRNGSDGIALDYTQGNALTGNTVQDNGANGIRLSDASQNTLASNTVVHNSQATDLAADNIFLTYSDSNVLQDNTCRAGPGPNRPAYGLHIREAGSSANQVLQNDLTDGGATAPLLDNGAGTVLSGNQL